MTEMEKTRLSTAAPLASVANDNADSTSAAMSLSELIYLRRGLAQPGGKLPLFDLDGQRVSPRIVRDCLARGLAEPWFPNPLKPDWLVCRLTDSGRRVAESPPPQVTL
jgi:hypothetical protein